MNNLPLVSIGLPVYNGEPFLKEALDSLLAQDYPNFELIISDNASTDGTHERCLDYAGRDGRIRYYRNSENLGASANWNRVFALARGQYFIWAAHDDLYEPVYISTLAHLLDDNPDAVLAFSAFDNIDAEGRQTKLYPDLFDLPADGLFQRLDSYMRQEECLGKANLICGLMRRQVIAEAGGAKRWGRGEWGPDMLIVFALLARGRLVLAEELLFHKRVLSPYQGLPAARESRVHPIFSTMGEQHGYFAGYRRLISIIGGLSFREKLRLNKTVWLRVIKFDWAAIRRTFIAPFPWRIRHFFDHVARLSYGWLIRRPFLYKLARALKKSFPGGGYKSGHSL